MGQSERKDKNKLKFGICILCRDEAQLVEHHVNNPTLNKKRSIMICKRCHSLIHNGI